jgi:hypothetical protein
MPVRPESRAVPHVHQPRQEQEAVDPSHREDRIEPSRSLVRTPLPRDAHVSARMQVSRVRLDGHRCWPSQCASGSGRSSASSLLVSRTCSHVSGRRGMRSSAAAPRLWPTGAAATARWPRRRQTSSLSRALVAGRARSGTAGRRCLRHGESRSGRCRLLTLGPCKPAPLGRQPSQNANAHCDHTASGAAIGIKSLGGLWIYRCWISGLDAAVAPAAATCV